MLKCRYCHKELQDDWKACPYCGNLVPTTNARGRKSPRRGNGQGSAYKRGKTWTAKVVVGWNITDGGEATPVTRTKGGFRTKADALAYCPELKKTRADTMAGMTLKELYMSWLEGYSDRVSNSAVSGYKAAFGHFKPIHHRVFTELLVADIQPCIDEVNGGKRVKEGMKSLMSLLYKYAMQNELVDRNRAQSLYTGNEKKGTRPAFTMEELRKICTCGLPYSDYVVCMCYLGYRPDEMLSLTKESYDREHQCLIGGSKTEAGKNRIVTIPPAILPLIERAYAGDGKYLFPSSHGGKLSANVFRVYYFNPLMEKLGIEGRVPYSCRHTYANLLKGVHGSDTDKAKLIGHADASMTKYYQSADYDSLRSITDSLQWVGD